MKHRRMITLLFLAIISVLATACASDEPAPDAVAGESEPADSDSEPADSESEAADSESEPIAITVGYIGDGNGAMLAAIAEDQDLWTKHGLEAETKVFTNGPIQIQALGAGDLDFGYIGPGAFWLPMQGQATVATINSLGRADRLVAQPGLDTFEALRGKTIGVAEGTSGDMILSLALEEYGMTEDDIEKVAMDPSTMISAFSSGQIDAAAIWYPHVETMRQQVPELVEMNIGEEFPELQFPAAQVAGASIAQDNPEALTRFQAVQKEAVDWATANPDELNTLLAEFLDAPEESIAAEMEHIEFLSSEEAMSRTEDGTIGEWLTNLNEMFVRFDKVDEVVDPATYYLGEEYVGA